MNYDQAVKAFGIIAIQIIEAQGMQAENMQCQALGRRMSYTEAHFYALSGKVKKVIEGLKTTHKKADTSKVMRCPYCKSTNIGKDPERDTWKQCKACRQSFRIRPSNP